MRWNFGVMKNHLQAVETPSVSMKDKLCDSAALQNLTSDDENENRRILKRKLTQTVRRVPCRADSVPATLAHMPLQTCLRDVLLAR